MKPIVISYRYRERVEQSRPPDGLPYRIIAAMIATRRFWRSARGVLLYEADPAAYVGITRAPELESILRDSGLFHWQGNEVPDDEWRAICYAVQDLRWKLPRVPRHVDEHNSQPFAGKICPEEPRLPSWQRRARP